MVKEGKCMNCAKPLNLYGHRCDECQEKIRDKHGNKPWKPGKRGRPPLGIKYEPMSESGKRYRRRNGL